MADPLLKVQNLKRVFDVSKPWLNRLIEREPKKFLTAVNDVSFEIQKGEIPGDWLKTIRGRLVRPGDVV